MNEQAIRVNVEFRDVVLRDMTLEQVKELRDILLRIVPVQPTVVREKEYVPYGYPYPVRPFWQWDTTPNWYVTTGHSSSSNTITLTAK